MGIVICVGVWPIFVEVPNLCNEYVASILVCYGHTVIFLLIVIETIFIVKQTTTWKKWLEDSYTFMRVFCPI